MTGTTDCRRLEIPAPRAGHERVGWTRDASEGAGRDETQTIVSDADLLRTLHDEHAGALWSYVMGLTNRDAARSQDVVQETLLRAWQRPPVLDQSERSARAWLFTVARRIVIDEWRSARARPEVVMAELPEPEATADHAQQTVDSAVVAAALGALSASHRAVLQETYVRGSSVAEAAARLGVPPGTVKSRTHYALQALKLAIEEMGGAL